MKTFKKIALFMMAVMSFAFVTSCDDDDNANNPLVGLWGIESYYSDGQYENAILFNSDGTGLYYDDYPSTTSGVDKFTYSYDEKTKTLVWTWDDDSEVNIWKLKSITDKVIYFEDEEYGYSDVLKKIK